MRACDWRLGRDGFSSRELMEGGQSVPRLDYQPTFGEPELFLVFLRLAKPGERFVYATCCNLARDNADAAGDVLSPTPEMAWDAYSRGWVCLTQRRVGPAKFEYIATRRENRRKSAKARVPAPRWTRETIPLAA